MIESLMALTFWLMAAGQKSEEVAEIDHARVSLRGTAADDGAQNDQILIKRFRTNLSDMIRILY